MIGTANRAAALPLLSHCLRAMDEVREGNELTHQGYAAVGRLGGAVASTAEDVYRSLTREQQQAARELLLRLVVVEPGMPPTAGDLPRREWGTEAAEVEVREQLTARRLLTVDEHVLRLSHEALMTAWPRLADWIEDDLDNLRISRLVTRESLLWQQTGDPDVLLRGGRLAAAVTAQHERPGLFPQPSRDFLAASKEAERAEADEQRRRLRRTRQLLVAVSVLAVASIVAGLGVVRSRAVLAEQRDAAFADQLAAQSRVNATVDPVLYSQLALASYRVAPTVASRSAVIEAAGAPATALIDAPVGLRIVATHGDLLATAGEDTDISLYAITADTPQLLATVPAPTSDEPDPAVYAAGFSPDGHRLVVGGSAGTVRVWDVTDPRAPRVLGEDLTVGATTHSLGFDNAGTLSVSAGAEGVRRWNLSADLPRELPTIAVTDKDGAPVTVRSVATMADGSLVVGTEAGLMGRWLADSGPTLVASVEVGSRGVNSIVETPAGVLAGLDHSKIVLLTPTADGLTEREEPFGTFGSIVNSVALSPDRSLIAVAAGDSTVSILTLSGVVLESFKAGDVPESVSFVGDRRLAIGVRNGRTLIRRLPAYPAPGQATRTIYALSISEDETRLLAPAYVGQALDLTLYTVSDTAELTEQARVTETPEPVERFLGVGAMSPSGRVIVAGATVKGAAGKPEARLFLWRVDDPAHPEYVSSVELGNDSVNYAEFVSEDTLLVTLDHRVVLVSVTADGSASISREFTASEDESGHVDSAVSTDGSTIAAVGYGGQILVWDSAGGSEPVATVPWQGYLYGVAFSPDGRDLAVTGTAREVRIYDVFDSAKPTMTRSLAGFSGTGIILEYNVDGKLLGVSESGEVKVWDSSNGYQQSLVLHEPDQVQVGVWSADGKSLAVGGNNGLIRWHNVDEQVAAGQLCRTLGSPMKNEQWAAVLAGAPRLPTLCS